MPAIQEITERLIRDHITRAIADVFKTMLGSHPEFAITTDNTAINSLSPLSPDGEALPQIVGTVGFLGDINGLIYLYLPLPLARRITCQLLGMSDAEMEAAGDDVINDAIGELTNMTVGSFKNGLSDAGFPCKLTIPSILRGSNFCIEPISSAQRFTYGYKSCGQRLVTDILLKTGD